ncbi:MAG: hypothetical protein DMG58_29255 [Acidobacteria bacterium]|nr:MAG: hypothetical protein DMG58_29255 [Acidobacteriota bacterium]
MTTVQGNRQKAQGKRQKWLLPLCAVMMGCSQSGEAPPKPVVAVKVAPVQTQDVQISSTAPATIFPREQASIAARITGPIRYLRVHKGDSVKAGDVLAALESRDVVAARGEICRRRPLAPCPPTSNAGAGNWLRRKPRSTRHKRSTTAATSSSNSAPSRAATC